MSHADLLTEILKDRRAAQPDKRTRRVPKGHEPGFKIDPDTGDGWVAVNVEAGHDPLWDDELAWLGLDAARFEVVGDAIEVRSWEGAIGKGAVKQFRYVKAKVRRRTATAARLHDDVLVEWIRERKPTRRKHPLPHGWDVLPITDAQLGKAHEGRGGTGHTLARYVDVVGQMQDRIREHTRLGIRAGNLFLPGGGDVLEGCTGQYPSQLWSIDLNGTEQLRVGWWLLSYIIRELAPFYDRVVTGTPISNHGEKRVDGKQVTDDADSTDLDVWYGAAHHFHGIPAFEHVEFVTPADPFVLTIDLDGVGCAVTHGHQFSGKDQETAAWKWWDGQISGRLPSGDCDLLVSAHRHHKAQRWQQGRHWEGLPAMDGGSQWLTNKTGLWAPAGQYVFSLDPGAPQPRRMDVLVPDEEALDPIDPAKVVG